MRTPVNNFFRDEDSDKAKQKSLAKITVSFYRYVILADPLTLRDDLFVEWSRLGVLGRVYLAEEGINAQISLPQSAWPVFVSELNERTELAKIQFKIGLSQQDSFTKLTIKVKKQIVADGLSPTDYDLTMAGEHLDPREFHETLNDPDIIVVDMRNSYESRIGRFEGAICPDVDTFREELPTVEVLLRGKEDKNILLYCTGGIRCEKASAYLRQRGFHKVKQLSGGIINYAHTMKQLGLPSKFKGKNFVFDARMAEPVTDDILTHCDQCGSPNDYYTNCSNVICNLLFIQCLVCREAMHGACSTRCRDIALSPATEQSVLRRQQTPTNRQIFKSRVRWHCHKKLDPPSLSALA